MCIFQPFTVELHPCSFARQSRVIGFRKRCFVLVHSEVCWGSVRFFEYAANSAGGERLRRGGFKTLRSRGETGDIIFTEWNLRFIQNVASCYRSPDFEKPWFRWMSLTMNNSLRYTWILNTTLPKQYWQQCQGIMGLHSENVHTILS